PKHVAVSWQLPAGREPKPELGSGAHVNTWGPGPTQPAPWFAHFSGVQPPVYLISEASLDVEPTSRVLPLQAKSRTASDEMMATFDERKFMGRVSLVRSVIGSSCPAWSRNRLHVRR